MKETKTVLIAMNKNLLLNIRHRALLSFFCLLLFSVGFSQAPLYENRLDVQVYQTASNFLLNKLITDEIPNNSFEHIGLTYERWIKKDIYQVQGLNFIYRQVAYNNFLLYTTEPYYQAAIFTGWKFKRNKNKVKRQGIRAYLEFDFIYEFNYGKRAFKNRFSPTIYNYTQQTHTLGANLRYGIDFKLSDHIYFNTNLSLLLGLLADRGKTARLDGPSSDDFQAFKIRTGGRLGFHAGFGVAW